MDDAAKAYQAHNDPVDPGSDDGEEALDHGDDEEYDTFSSCAALDDVSVFAAAELDAIALLADTWDDNLGPEVSAQLVQASAQAYLSFGKEKRKCKGKAKGEGKGRYLVRPSHRHWRTPSSLSSKPPDAYSSYDDTTTPLWPTEEGHKVFRSQRLQR